jgi:hypothetical protein
LHPLIASLMLLVADLEEEDLIDVLGQSQRLICSDKTVSSFPSH